MARKQSRDVFLGYEDEEISADMETNSKVNKIGGKPDWPILAETDAIPPCSICGMRRPLILQLYAPLEQSLYHRTFYVFACLKPTCSQHAKSWTCLRIQNLDTKSNQSSKSKQKPSATKINWCNNFDDWGTQESSCDDEKMLEEEENGNENNNTAAQATFPMLESDEEDDDYDENLLMGNTIVNALSQLNLKQKNKENNLKPEPNANCAAGLTLANESDEQQAFAEIETEETDLVLAEAPIKPRSNLRELLQTPSQSTFKDFKDLTLKPFFIAVDIEQQQQPSEEYGNLSVEHIQEIYEKYKLQDDDAECFGAAGGGVGGGGGENGEAYEASLPLHGDAMFHKFLSTIKMNPTQILRYSRDQAPILIEPLVDFDFKCKHCNGPTICEFQILSTLIPKLRFNATNDSVPIDFGNVLIFTCLRSCWETNDKMHFENVVVQKEK